MKSKGFGDTIEKITESTGIKYVVESVSKAIGKDCGCKARKASMNNPELLINRTFYNTKNK
jgi:hypothetical protein